MTMKHSNDFCNRRQLISSDETVGPPISSRMLLDDTLGHAVTDWQSSNNFFGWFQNLPTSKSSGLNGEPLGIRRTPSGMSLTHEDKDEGTFSEGLSRKIVDIINTTKDMTHVLWMEDVV
jgi:hypothetical protein